MSFTNAQLAQKISDLIDYWSSFNTEYSNWVGGAVDGGPNSDGEYPLTNWAGVETLLPSPAKLSDNVTGYVAIVAASETAAAASAAAAATSESNAATSETNADADAVAAAASAAAAAVDEGLAASSATVATAQANLATDRAGYAAEWANNAYNVLVSVAAGGNGVDEYSARHWAEHAASLNPGASPSLYARTDILETFDAGLNVTGALAATGAVTGSNLNVSNWDTAYGWGNHASAGYITDLVNDTTPQLGGNLSVNGQYITETNHGRTGGQSLWGDGTTTEADWSALPAGVHHFARNTVQYAPVANYGYFTKVAQRDSGGAGWGGLWVGYSSDQNYIGRSTTGPITWAKIYTSETFTDNSANWDTAYGWGNHASGGYAPTASPTFTGSVLADVNELLIQRAGGEGDVRLIVEADSDNLGAETDQAELWLAQDGRGVLGYFRTVDNNNLEIGSSATTVGTYTTPVMQWAYNSNAVTMPGSLTVTGDIAAGNIPAYNSFTGGAIVTRHSSGYIFSNYFNQSIGSSTTGVPTHVPVCTGSDGYFRWQTLAQFIDNLESQNWAFLSVSSMILDGIVIDEFSPRAGLIEVNRDGTSSWAGYGIYFSSTAHWAFMANETQCGIYDDYNNDWHVYCTENAGVSIRHNGTERLLTTSTGVQIAAGDDITKASHGNYLYHQSTAYDNDQNGGVTFSTSAASGGVTGDIWFQYS